MSVRYHFRILALCTLIAASLCGASAAQEYVYVPQGGMPLHGSPWQGPMQQNLGELEYLAVDIARRSILAHYPQAGHDPMRTLEARVRPEGDAVHTFAKVQWSFTDARGTRYHEAEVFASLIYTPDARRMFDISYKDNYLVPHRAFNRKVDLLSKFNEEFDRRDPLRMPAPLVGRRMDFLAPRRAGWVWNILSGDHAWHANVADDQIHPAWIPSEPPVPTP